MINPYRYGDPVAPKFFIGRPHEVRRLVGRISTGQSAALVGEPRTGKTSLLGYLQSREGRPYYRSTPHRLHFCYLDAQTLGAQFTQTQFWQHALQPLYEDLMATGDDHSSLVPAFQTCVDNDFSPFVLDRFFAQVGMAKHRHVLLLDEFDALLYHPVLNNAEFFGGLRSLTSRSQGALCIITASRQHLGALNKRTQELSRTGSPYFNFLNQITLAPFIEKSCNELLDKAGERFNSLDRAFILRVASGHPYLLQVTASFLWDAYEEEEDPYRRRKKAGEWLFDEVSPVISDTWRLWSPETKKAFTAIALEHSALMLGGHKYDVSQLQTALTSLGPELRALKNQGYIEQDPETSCGYHVRAEAFLWWLSDELIRTVRDDTAFDEWFQAQQWEGLMKKEEKQRFNQAVQIFGGMIKEGVGVFISSAASGASSIIFK